MILDHNWTFDAATDVSMPNNTTSVLTNYIDWTANKWKDWINTPQPLWLLVVCTAVPSAGTSIQVRFYQHSTSSLASGDLLLSGRAIAKADLSADPDDEGHILFCVPLMSCICTVQAADRDRYCGLVLSASGDVSSGTVRSWLHMGVNPPVYVPRPALRGGSNIVMPTA